MLRFTSARERERMGEKRERESGEKEGACEENMEKGGVRDARKLR